MKRIKNLAIAAAVFGVVITGCSSGTAKTENSDINTEKSVVANTENSVVANTEKSVVANTEKKTIHLTNTDFKTKVFNYEVNKEWKYEGDKPCIIDFYADWCGPCKKIAPVLEELAGDYDGKVIIYKVDTEKERELASAFGIRSIPSLLFVPVSGQPQMAQGALPKEQFEKIINEFLLKASE